MKKIIFLIPAILLIAAACNNKPTLPQTNQQLNNPQQSQSSSTNQTNGQQPNQMSSNITTMEITGNTMTPTLKAGDLILIDGSVKTYNRGDIVEFRDPQNQSQIFVKRIVGLPGERVEFKNIIKNNTVVLDTGAVYINEAQLDESKYLSSGVNTFGPSGVITLKSNEYYVLGDNRTASSDSRVYGPISQELILGKYVGKSNTTNQK